MRTLILCLLFLFISACKPTGKVVEALTSAILEPVTLQLSTNPNLGEISVGSDSIPIIVTITNNSSDPIKKLNLNIGTTLSTFNFTPDSSGFSQSPGYLGTCTDTLSPHQTCTYNLVFTPRKAGQTTIPVLFTYENLINADSKTFTLTALTGEPAALAFTNDISKYDFGVIEQTIPEEKNLTLEIQNVGGLTARNINYPLTNTPAAHPAYRIIENKCPASIAPQEKCKITIGYKPLNNNYTDPETTYSGQLSMTFTKDSTGKTDKLNAFFNFISSTIEAKFSTNYSTLDFGQVVAGNNLLRSFKITNKGYNTGVMKTLSFLDSSGNVYTTCTKGTTNTLNCNKTLYDFPFIIQDSSNCFEKEVAGNVGSTTGDSCFFNITYWPSRTYQPGSQSVHNFKNTFLSLTYDSRWLNKPNIVTVNKMFNINGDFIAAGKVILDSILVEDQYLSTSKITTPNSPTVYEADLGRIAKTADPSMTTYYKISLKNVGESPVTLASLVDGAVSPHQVTDLGYDINAFYKSIKYSSCDYIAPGASCSFSYFLSPTVQSTAAIEDGYMYDNVSNPLKKYKTFSFNYLDGSMLNDDGTNATNANIEIHFISKLIAKGFLAFVEPLTLTIPKLINGTTITQIINLKNVGTGDIYAISHHPTNNFFPKSGIKGWPYRIIPLGTVPLPSTKDCYNILFPAGLPLMATPPDTSKFLSPGQSCALGIEIKDPNIMRRVTTDYTTYLNHERLFGVGLNGTTDLWARNNSGGSSGSLITFNYYDGDANPDDPLAIPYGYLNKTKDMNVSSSFYAAPSIISRDPTPSTSALLARPALTYPLVSMTYPISSTLNAYNIPESYFESSYFNAGVTNLFTSSYQAITHVKSLGIVHNDVIFHIGTFPVGSVNYAQFNFNNTGGSTAQTAILNEDVSAGSPITIYSYNGLTAKPFPSLNVASGQSVPLKLKFAPTVAGTFYRCYELDYNNQIGNTWGHRVCAYGEAVNTAPKFKVEYQDINVTYDILTNTVTETPSGVWNTLNSPINVPLNAPIFGPDTTSIAAFSAVKGSAAYALKLFRVTNIGTAAATKFNYAFLGAPNVPTTLISEVTTRNGSGTNPTCSGNMTVAVNDACEFYVKYKPISTSANLYSPYLGLVYDTASNLNQFVSQTSTVQFSAIDPAKLLVSIPGVSSESVTDWSNSTTPLPQSVSWPITVNNYSAADTHMITTSLPTTKIITNIQVNNTSSIKASFLAMNPTPAAGTWNTIFTNTTMTIKANRYCFYGDDENNSSVAAIDKGFNATSVNKCMLQFEFSGNSTFQNCSAYNAPVKSKTVIMGGRIQASCNPYVYTLSFYNYKRSSTEKMYVHMKGFIEPNRTVATTNAFSNVSAVSTSASVGSVTFTWPTISPNNSAFGNISKYRIYYSTNYADLRTDNIFYGFTATPVLSYFETSSAAINTATINNLSQGIYYFFRIVAIRSYAHPTYGNLTYMSVPSNLPILTLLVPNTSQTYNHSLLALVDKTTLSNTGSRTNGINACAAQKYSITVVGAAKQITKQLANTNVWNYIAATPTASTGYPSNDVGTLPHWLSDAAYNIKTNISLYSGSTIAGFPGYDSTKLTGNNASLKLIYSKTCTSSPTCDQLFKLVGGDNVDLYYQGTYYTTDAGVSAYYRCYGVLLCPTNTAKTITDPTCAAP